MIGNCFNPECNQELLYLSQGSVFAWESIVEGELHSEFFWLCSNCSQAFNVASGENGRPVLWPRSKRIGPDLNGSRVRRVLAGEYDDFSEK